MEPGLLIGVSARIYYPGSDGKPLAGVWTKTLHYLEQSVAHWVLAGGAMAVMVPAVDSTSIVKRSDLDLHDYAAALDGLDRQHPRQCDAQVAVEIETVLEDLRQQRPQAAPAGHRDRQPHQHRQPRRGIGAGVQPQRELGQRQREQRQRQQPR